MNYLGHTVSSDWHERTMPVLAEGGGAADFLPADWQEKEIQLLTERPDHAEIVFVQGFCSQRR
jgi:hypothetical protein